jgi:hypothetical protein
MAARIHFLSILLVFEHNCDEGCEQEQVGVGMGKDSARGGPEDNATKADPFSAAGSVGLGVFAGAHSEEVGSEGDVSGVGMCRVLAADGSAREEFVEFAEKFWCDCFLATGRRVGVVVCF